MVTRRLLAILVLVVVVYYWPIVSTATVGPSAHLAVPGSAYVGEVVLVDARSSIGVCDKPQTDSSRSIEITYGDDLDPAKPRISELPASGHLYDRAGTFTVTAKVKDCQGNTATTSAQIVVREIPAASGGEAISDSCLVNGTGNNVQVLVDKKDAALNGTCLQAALNRAAQRGTVEQEIVLPATAVYDGEIVLPVTRVGDKYITIRSANLSTIPSSRRAGPSDAPNMPTIQAKVAQGFGATAITLLAGTHHYRLQGLHVRRDSPTGPISRAVYFNGFGTTRTFQTSHILMESMWVDGGPMPANTNQQNIRVGIDIYGKFVSVRNSTLGNYALRGTGVDTSSISISGGEGPFGLVRNEMVASSENFSVSGSSLTRTGTITAATPTTVTLSSVDSMEADQSIALPVGGQYHPRWTSVIRSVSGNTITFDRLRDGATPDIGGLAEAVVGTPSFIDFRNNYLHKLSSWRKGSPQSDGNNDYQIKNAVEMKCGRYASYWGNVIENMWIGDQPYTGFVMFPSGGVNGCNAKAAEVRYVEVVSNYYRNMSSGDTVLGHQHTNPISGTTSHIYFRNNLKHNVGPAFENSSAPMAGVSLNMDFGEYLSHIVYVHNTHDIGAWAIGKITDFGSTGGVQDGTGTWKNNVNTKAELGIWCSLGQGTVCLQRYFPPGDASNFSGNVIHNTGGVPYPAGNIYPSGAFSALFVDYTKGDFRLVALGKGAATDGTDAGADIAQLQAAIGADSPALGIAAIRVISGQWSGTAPQPAPSATPTPTPSVTPAPQPSPSPLPSVQPTPHPTPAPTPLECSMTVAPVTMLPWATGKLIATFTNLPNGSLRITATGTSGQVWVSNSPQTVSGTSAIVEFQLRSKNKSASVVVSGPCGQHTVPITVR